MLFPSILRNSNEANQQTVVSSTVDCQCRCEHAMKRFLLSKSKFLRNISTHAKLLSTSYIWCMQDTSSEQRFFHEDRLLLNLLGRMSFKFSIVETDVLLLVTISCDIRHLYLIIRRVILEICTCTLYSTYNVGKKQTAEQFLQLSTVLCAGVE